MAWRCPRSITGAAEVDAPVAVPPASLHLQHGPSSKFHWPRCSAPAATGWERSACRTELKYVGRARLRCRCSKTCWPNCVGHADADRGDASLRRGGARGLARQLQCVEPAGAASPGSGSIERPLLRVHQSPTQPPQDFVVGRIGLAGLRKTVGKRPVHLAGRRRPERVVAFGGTGCIGLWSGSACQIQLVSTVKITIGSGGKGSENFLIFS